MNDTLRYWLQTILGVLIRDVLKWLAGALAAWGVAIGREDQERLSHLLLALAMAVIAYGWSLLARWRDKQSLPLPDERPK